MKTNLKIVQVKPNEMHFDHERYQRGCGPKRLAKMGAFDWAKVGVLYVSLRVDGYYVVDGQARCMLAKSQGMGDTPLPCVLLENTTPENEAGWFARQKQGVEQLSATDLFHARVGSKEPLALAINSVANGFGLQITNSRGQKAVRAVGALEQLYTSGVLPDVLSIVVTLSDKRATDGPLLIAVGYFLQHYAQADRARLAERLRDIRVGQLLFDISNDSKRMSRKAACITTLRAIYNGKRTGKDSLPPFTGA